MKRFIQLVFLTAIITFASASHATAITFSAADLSGHWRGAWLETTEDGDDDFTDESRYWLQVDADIEATGAFDSGTWSSSGGMSGNVTGGTLTITSEGAISGTMNINVNGGGTESVSVILGWMDQGKEIVYLGFQKAGGRTALGMMTKYADNGFNTAMLEGDWEAVLLEADTTDNDATYWIDAEVEIDNLGDGVGWWNYQGAQSGVINSSPFTLDSFGKLGGTLNLNTGSAVTLNGGQLDPQLNCGSFATTKTDGELAGGIFVRIGGTGFTTSDLKGTWVIYRTATYDEQQMSWVSGEITFDNAGSMTSGTWVAPSGNTGSYTAASFALTAGGKLSGSYSTDNGNTLTIGGGNMGRTKTYATAVSKSNNGILEVVFMIKKADNVNVTPAINMLIDLP